jgi:hypothetical protein
VSGTGSIETAILPENGQYTILLDPTDDATGQATLRAVLAAADSSPITLDGSTLSANISKPGSTSSFTFNGTAGQKIYVDIPSSELPSQCGILLLRAPDGGTVASGCIINKKGNLADAATTLPATGQYTITLDPNDSTTGKTTIRLRSH